MHQQTHGRLGFYLRPPGTQAVLRNDPTAGTALSTGTPIEKRPDGTRQTLGTQTGDGVTHRARGEVEEIDTEQTREKQKSRSLPAIRLAVVARAHL